MELSEKEATNSGFLNFAVAKGRRFPMNPKPHIVMDFP
jgi:hypothetical protein